MQNKEVTLRSAEVVASGLARCNLFANGYTDYMKNISFDYDKTVSFSYERGRAFAIFTKAKKLPKATWRQGVLSKAATNRLIGAFYTGYVR